MHRMDTLETINSAGFQVSRATVFWALVPTVLNSMTQPAGNIWPDLTSEENFFLRFSPLTCVVDSALLLIEGLWSAMTLKNRAQAVAYIRSIRFPNDSPSDTALRSFQERFVFRAFLFLLGALPQVLKLLACKGIPWVKLLALTYIGSFCLLELLVRRLRQEGLTKIAIRNDKKIRLQRISLLFLRLRYAAVVVSDLAFAVILHGYSLKRILNWNKEISRNPVVEDPMIVVWSYLCGFFLAPFTIFLLPDPYGSEMFNLPLPGAAAGFIFFTSRLPNSLQSFVVVLLLLILILTAGLARIGIDIRDPYCFLSHIAVGLALLVVLYDPAVTYKPLWTEYLG